MTLHACLPSVNGGDNDIYRFLWWLSGKQFRRRGFNPWIRKFPWRRKLQPTPVFLPGEFQGQRSLLGYSPWGVEIEIGFSNDSATTKITIIPPLHLRFLWGLNDIIHEKHLGQCQAQIAFIFLRKKWKHTHYFSSLFCAKATVLGGFLFFFCLVFFFFFFFFNWIGCYDS